jgi:hypothetical protein
MFAIGKSTVHLVLHEFIHAINVVFKNRIKWPKGEDLLKGMIGFKNFFGLQYVYGAIDVTQVDIQNPKRLFAGNYYW